MLPGRVRRPGIPVSVALQAKVLVLCDEPFLIGQEQRACCGETWSHAFHIGERHAAVILAQVDDNVSQRRTFQDCTTYGAIDEISRLLSLGQSVKGIRRGVRFPVSWHLQLGAQGDTGRLPILRLLR